MNARNKALSKEYKLKTTDELEKISRMELYSDKLLKEGRNKETINVAD